MVARRIIACMDVRDGRVVKGVNFLNLRDMGDPVELGKRYRDQGADELVYLDIAATVAGKKIRVDLVRAIARNLDIPFTVGGGIRNECDVEVLLEAGADKVTVNSAAVSNPGLITRLARAFGSQCVVVAVDAGIVAGSHRVFVNGGRKPTTLDVVAWTIEAANHGAGEILLTSMERDGTGSGYDTGLLRRVSMAVSCPLIASGGGGELEDFAAALEQGGADAVLAAGVFHSGRFTISQVKDFLAARSICVRREA